MSEAEQRCKFCRSLNSKCLYSGPRSVGRCYWAGLMTAMKQTQKALTSGHYVDRAIRGQEIIDKALERYGDE